MKALIRISSDIVTKAPRTRSRFTRRLVENLRAGLQREAVPARVHRDHVRIYLEADDARAFEIARRVFGVHSLSPCIEEPYAGLDTLLARGEALFRDEVRGRGFAVRAKVRGVAGLGSQAVNEQLGERLMEYGRVDLTAPEVTAQVEVRGGKVRFFTSRMMGPGGLPVGVEGRAVVLLSGGFDSAVAAWMMLRRGVGLDYVFCRLGGVRHERAVLKIANTLSRLWSAGSPSRLYVLPFEAVAELIVARVPEALRQLVLKRVMYAVGEALAQRVRAHAVITGEALGQVSSQTLRNLRALGSPRRVGMLRPLVGFNKEEIIARSREIGTHDLCAGVPEYCALVPRKPATGAGRSQVDEATALVPFDATEAARMAVRHDLPAPLPADDVEGEVEVIPPDALVIDIRAEALRRAAPFEGALEIDPSAARADFETLDPDRSYVVVCEHGLRSAWLARHLRRLGFDAVNLRQGMGG
ncbi:MAG: THUMP domain-containing protein [Acidobacteriota bacterium]|nr:THUMP domain-containing protein [Acidobacteriota bacterium]MDQ7088501.1 THUMP domain-containing protein [Acidobacteriota bacterium]